MADGNEFNYMVDEKKFENPYFIDVDSYQTPSFGADAVMETIRDYERPSFCAESDWFAFAVVTCQLLVGIHPFKGRHPDFARHDLEGRMRGRISIFNRRVTVPPSVRDFSVIPRAYREWFVELFENGKRCPPSPVDTFWTPGLVSVAGVREHGALSFIEEEEYGSEVLDWRYIGGKILVRTEDCIYFDQRRFDAEKGELYATVFGGTRLLGISVRQGRLAVRSMDGLTVHMPELSAEHCLVIHNRIFAYREGMLVEAAVAECADTVVIAPGTWRETMPRASTLFSTLVYQDALGTPLVLIPVVTAYGKTAFVEHTLAPLCGRRICHAHYDKGVIMTVTNCGSGYRRSVFTFSDDHIVCTFCGDRDVETAENRFVTLVNGVVVAVQDGAIELFHVSDPDHKRRISADSLDASAMIYSCGTDVWCAKGGRMYRLKLMPEAA